MSPHDRRSTLARAAVGLVFALTAAGAFAQSAAGEVEFSRGVGFAQTPGGTPRTLGKGLPLQQGDRLTTSDGASAIIKLQDGTRMTVRPNSELVLQNYQFKENAPDNSMLMQLVRGGFRAVTGLISKNAPNAARVQTATATIGIRGTDFDARVCSRDCGGESANVQASARPNAVQASAKVILSRGEVYAVSAAGERRRIVDGGAVYPGELVETTGNSQAVLAFRDDSRVTLGSNTRFRVDNFVYDERNAGEGRFLATLLRGSMRALTGLIAKSNNRNVGFTTPTATIGIRGTGLDADCPGEDPKECTLWTWLGSIEVTPNGTSALQVLLAGQGLFIGPSGIRPVFNSPNGNLPSPDGVNVPPKLFTSDSVSDAEEGLFVFVRDGHIEILTAKEILHLGKGEAGYAGLDGDAKRPTSIPKFLDFDKLPLPTSKNPLAVSILGNTVPQQCN